MEVKSFHFYALAAVVALIVQSCMGAACGSNYRSLDGERRVITSPFQRSYMTPCRYTISVPVGKRIQINFIAFNHTSSRPSYSNIIFKIIESNGSFVGAARIHRSGKEYPTTYLTVGNVAQVVAMHEKSYGVDWSFTFEYVVVDGCNMIFGQPEGMFDSSDAASHQPANSTCTYQISGKPGERITLGFPQMNLDGDATCSTDKLSIYEGKNSRANFSQIRCGSNVTQFLSKSNRLFLVFHANNPYYRGRFKIYYAIGKQGCNKNYTRVDGKIEAPLFPFYVPYNVKCLYRISSRDGRLILVEKSKSDRRSFFFTIREGNYGQESYLPYSNYKNDYDYTDHHYYVSRSNELSISYDKASYGSNSVQLKYSMITSCSVFISSEVSYAYIASPHFPLSNRKPVACSYTVTAPSGVRAQLEFVDMNLENSSPCTVSNVSVYDGSNDRAEKLYTLCGSKKTTIVSKSSKLFLKFETTGERGIGFLAYFRRYYPDECSKVIKAESYPSSGSMSSVKYPHKYPNNLHCESEILASFKQTVRIYFDFFSMQSSAGCKKDSLKIYKDHVSDETMLWVGCGNQTTTVKVVTKKLIFVFKSDLSLPFNGYQLRYKVCGGYLSHQNRGLRHIQSPDYPNSYPDNMRCIYDLNADYGKIVLNFTSFELEASDGCKKDWIKIYNGSISSDTLVQTRCGNDTTPYITTALRILIVFHSDMAVARKGFRIGFSGCNTFLTSSSGTFQSPNYPSNYPNLADCSYKISVSAGKFIKLHIGSFDLEDHSRCGYDKLAIYDGSSTNATLLAALCGISYNVTEFKSSGSDMYVRFTTDGSVRSSGFQANYSEVVRPSGGACARYSPCQNNGSCYAYSEEDFTCNCLSDYTDRNCSTKIIPCDANPCQNGVCLNVYGKGPPTFDCKCTNGYRGRYCEEHYDECQSYVSDSRWQRSVSYMLTGPNDVEVSFTGPSYCDAQVESNWTRFTSKAGGEMPMTCPPLNSCGTSGSIWANGVLPQFVGNYSNVTACVRDEKGCCSESWTIQVKKCQGAMHNIFYIYQLRQPKRCPMAYCAGTEVPCEPGWNSETGFTPGCMSIFPKIIARPIITPGKMSSKRILICKIFSDATGKESVFEVTWYQGASMMPIDHTHYLHGKEREAYLDTTKYHLLKLGNNIICRVRTWYAKYNYIKGPLYSSDPYYAGILVNPTQDRLEVTESGKPLKLTIMITIPLQCGDVKDCLRLQFKTSNSEALLSHCSLGFKNGEANQTKTIEINAKRDFINDGYRTMMLATSTAHKDNPQPWRKHQEIGNVKIHVYDTPTASCTTTNDPRIITLDGKYYSHLQPGDHVFLKSLARNFEVHVRTMPCSRGTCNCGIAARENNDVIVLDACWDGIPRPRFASSKTEPALGTSLRRDQDGKGFIIKFPSGAKIETGYFQTSAFDFANIWVTVSNDDYNQTRGLCGTFDGDSNNEMLGKDGKYYDNQHRWHVPWQFSESWRLPVGRSLFYYRDTKTKCPKVPEKKYCHCSDFNTARCNRGSAAEQVELKKRDMTTLVNPAANKCNKRKRRSLDAGVVLPEDDDSVFYKYDPAPMEPVNITWPTTSGKTQSQVRSYCNQKLRNSAPGKLCTKLPDFSFDTYVQQCMDDIQVSDDYAFIPAAVQAMQEACGEVLVQNVTYWEPNPAKNGSMMPSLEMARTMCPGLCNGNGRCVNGTCICNGNYTASDCSIDKSKGPTVKSISSNGTCDVRKRSDCHLVKITGRDFMNVDSLSCRTTKLLVSSKPYEKTNDVAVNSADLLSYGEIMCNLKSHPVVFNGDVRKSKSIPFAGTLLEISNDGKIYSRKKILYVIYDSKCIACDGKTAVCSLKPNTCNINGYCFSNGEKYSGDQCYICNPSSSQFQLTANCVAKSDNKIIVIASSVSTVIFLAIVITIIIIINVKKRRVKAKTPIADETNASTSASFGNAAYTGHK